MSASTPASLSAPRWATPEVRVWTEAPPSSSKLTSSLVTDLMTSGPVMNM